MDVRIRQTQADDTEAVESVLRASYPPLMAPAYDPDLLARALPLMTRADPRLLGSGRFFLAEVDGEKVGCGGWSNKAGGSDEFHPGIAHVRLFATAAAWTGRGIGRRIFQRCEHQARLHGVRHFLCHSSLNGEPFYRALGFERIERVEVAMGPALKMPCVKMRRELGKL